MNRTDYLADRDVRAFLEWARPFVAGERRVDHEWRSRSRSWSCETLYDAYRSYDWRFSLVLPGQSVPVSGDSLDDTLALFDRLSAMLRGAMEERDNAAFVDAATAVLRWGRVNGERRLRALGSDALPRLVAASIQLDPWNADLDRLEDVRDMSSGFSKIYALMLEGLPIYDSRVACALASFVRRFCQERRLESVPSTLAFGVPPSQGRTVRNPSTANLKFPPLRYGSRRRYARSNIMAAWLLDALAVDSAFEERGVERRVLAIQSAMFMIGYSPLRCFSEAMRRGRPA